MCGRNFGNFLIPALASVLVADSTNQNQTGYTGCCSPCSENNLFRLPDRRFADLHLVPPLRTGAQAASMRLLWSNS